MWPGPTCRELARRSSCTLRSSRAPTRYSVSAAALSRPEVSRHIVCFALRHMCNNNRGRRVERARSHRREVRQHLSAAAAVELRAACRGDKVGLLTFGHSAIIGFSNQGISRLAKTGLNGFLFLPFFLFFTLII